MGEKYFIVELAEKAGDFGFYSIETKKSIEILHSNYDWIVIVEESDDLSVAQRRLNFWKR